MTPPTKAAEIAAGDWLHDERGDIRVMSVVGRYAMARRPTCIPFVIDLKTMMHGRYSVLGKGRRAVAHQLAGEKRDE